MVLLMRALAAQYMATHADTFWGGDLRIAAQKYKQ